MSLCLLFPGQGSQSDGMFADWGLAPASLAAALREVVTIEPSLLSIEAMRRNAVAQPAIVAFQLAACAALASVVPDDACVLGYSVGELSAVSLAGCLSPEAAIHLAARRAALMDDIATANSGLVAVRGLPLERICRLAAEHGVEVAIENGPDHAIVGGPGASLDAMMDAAQAAGARTVRRLPVTISSHTSDLVAAGLPFRQILAEAIARAPSRPFISGVGACPLASRDAIVDSLAVQLHTRLRFADAVRAACECGATGFLEVGPGDGLTQIVGDLLPEVSVRPLHLFRSATGVSKWIEAHCR